MCLSRLVQSELNPSTVPAHPSAGVKQSYKSNIGILGRATSLAQTCSLISKSLVSSLSDSGEKCLQKADIFGVTSYADIKKPLMWGKKIHLTLKCNELLGFFPNLSEEYCFWDKSQSSLLYFYPGGSLDNFFLDAIDLTFFVPSRRRKTSDRFLLISQIL